MYSWKTKIRYTETEQDGRLSLTAMINLLQDCSTFHTEESGRGLAYHLPRHEGWYIFSWQIDIDEMPRLGEEVSVNTWPASYQGVIVNRDFEILRGLGWKVPASSSFHLGSYESGPPASSEVR